MMGRTAQKAPKGTQAAKGQARKQAEPEKRPIDRLGAISPAAGLAVMLVLAAIALPVGNMRAYKAALPGDFMSRRDVGGIVEQRIQQAANVITAAKRADVSEELILEVETQMEAMKAADSARQLSRADQALLSAVSELSAQAMTRLAPQDTQALTRAMDNFAEQGSFLRQEAHAHNRQAEKAMDLYGKLPCRFLLEWPDLYEGL